MHGKLTSKHSLQHSHIHLPHSHHAAKLLARLSPGAIAQLALDWLNSTPRTTGGVREDTGDDGQGLTFTFDAESPVSRRRLYQESLDEPHTARRAAVIRAVKEDWPAGFTYHQVAQLDIQHFQDKGTSKTWTAYRADLPAGAAIPSSAQLFERFQAAFGAYHAHYLHLTTLTAPYALTLLRVQLLSPASSISSTSSSRAVHPPALLLLHLPNTPFLLLPPLPSALRPLILLALACAFSPAAPAQLHKLELEGKDPAALRALLLHRASNVGLWRELRTQGERDREGGVLVPRERRHAAQDPAGKENDPPLLPCGVPALPAPGAKAERAAKRRRTEEVAEVFGAEPQAEVEGGEELPRLERLDYTVALPYPASATPFAPTPASEPPFLLRLEGTHVLSGLRALVAQGFTDAPGGNGGPGLPSWLGEVAGEGVNRLRVGRRADGTVGRV